MIGNLKLGSRMTLGSRSKAIKNHSSYIMNNLFSQTFKFSDAPFISFCNVKYFGS